MTLATDAPSITQDGLTSARLRIRRWVRDRMTGLAAVSLPEIADAAREHFLADPTFLAGPIGDLIRVTAYDEAGSFCADTRAGMVLFGEEAVAREAAREHVRTRLPRNPFVTWMEHAADRVLRLMDMTSAELDVAAAERERRGKTELLLAKTWRAIAARLDGDEPVRDRFTPQEIAELYRTIRAQQD